MNNLKFLGLCLICLTVCARVSAQNKIPTVIPDTNKPKLFANMPDRIPVDMQELQSLFVGDAVAGKQVKMDFADHKLAGLSGKIVSNTSKYDNKIHTLIIRSTNFSGATLTLSSSIQSDGTVKYIGRIISFQHGDLYELEKQNDQYVLIKKNFRDLVSD
jgi:hypothetical protein